MKLTAMQELFICFPASEEVKNVYLEKEKQQIIDVCVEFGMHNDNTNKERGEQYYKETFKNKNYETIKKKI